MWKEALKGKVINFTKEFIFILKAVTIRFDQDEEDLSERRVLFPRNRRIILKSLSGWSENIIETGNQLWFSITDYLIPSHTNNWPDIIDWRHLNLALESDTIASISISPKDLEVPHDTLVFCSTIAIPKTDRMCY